MFSLAKRKHIRSDYGNGPPHMAKQKQDDQPELTYSSYVRTQDVTQKTCRGRWTIGKSGERGSRISVLAARLDDDDDETGGIFVCLEYLSKHGKLYQGLYYILYLRAELIFFINKCLNIFSLCHWILKKCFCWLSLERAMGCSLHAIFYKKRCFGS